MPDLFPVRKTFYGSALGGLSVSNTVKAANQSVAFRPGMTLWLTLQSTGPYASGTEVILGCTTGTSKGWLITRAGTPQGALIGYLFMLSSAGGVVTGPPIPLNGVVNVCIVWSAANNGVTIYVNGALAVGPIVLAPGTAEDSTSTAYIGSAAAGWTTLPFTSGRIFAAATWSTEASAAQAKAYTYTTGNRFKLPRQVTSAAVFNFDAAAVFKSPSFQTSGPAPVTFAVAGTPALVKAGEKRLSRPVNSSSLAAAATDANGNRITIHSSFAHYRAVTDGLHAGVEITSTLYQYWPTQSGVGTFCNGNFLGEVSALGDSTPIVSDIQLPAGSGKNVDLWEGGEAYEGAPLAPFRAGTFIRAIRVPIFMPDGVTAANSSLVQLSAPSVRGVIVGDSIPTGWRATQMSTQSATAILRQQGYRINCLGVGSEAIWYLARTPTLAKQSAALVAAGCDGAANVVVVHIGTNDYGIMQGYIVGWNAAAFQAAFDNYIAEIIAQCPPGTKIVIVTPIQRLDNEAANAAGSTLTDYRNAEIAVANKYGLTWVDGTKIVGNANMHPDGVHPATAGHAQLATVYAAAIDGAYTQFQSGIVADFDAMALSGAADNSAIASLSVGTQSNAALKPTFLASGWSDGSPAISFTKSSNQHLRMDTLASRGLGPYTVVSFVRRVDDTANTQQALVGWSDAATRYEMALLDKFYTGGGEPAIQGTALAGATQHGVSPGTPLTEDALVIEALDAAGNITCFANGTMTTATGATVTGPFTAAAFGAVIYQGNPVNGVGGKVRRQLIYNRAFALKDIAAAADAMGGVAVWRSGLVVQGDSISNSSNGWPAGITLPAQLITNEEYAVSGRTIVYTTYSTTNNITDNLAAAFANYKASVPRIWVVWAGTNDVYYGADGPTALARLQALIALIKANCPNDYIVTAPMLDRVDWSYLNPNYLGSQTPYRTARAYVNAAIYAGQSGADDIWDTLALAAMLNPGDLTYFQSDGVHPNATGAGVLRTDIQGRLDGWRKKAVRRLIRLWLAS